MGHTFLLSVLLIALHSPAPARAARPTRAARAEILYRQALARLDRNTIDTRRLALRDLEQATLLDPENAAYELTLARVYYRCGFLKSARTRFEKVSQLAPQDAAGRFGLGQVWRRDWLKYLDPISLDKAIEHFSSAARLDPGQCDSWLMLVPLLCERGDLAGALSAAERALQADPKRADALVALAYSSYRLGRVARSDSAFAAALPRLPREVRERFEDISPVATERDTMTLRRLSPILQIEYVRRFWQDIDPDLATRENEAQLEYWSRVAHAYFLYYDARRGAWDERGEVYVRYGPPAHAIYNPVGVPLADAKMIGGGVRVLGSASNILLWQYPRLGMTVEMYDRLLTENYMLPISLDRDPDPLPDPDSVATLPDAVVPRGGRGVFPALPPGARALRVEGAIARFETDRGARLMSEIESPGGPGDSLWAEWVVLDSTRHPVTRGSRAMSPSACDATELKVADFAAELSPGDYQVGLTVRDGSRGRGVFRGDVEIPPRASELDLSDVVVSCGLPSGAREGQAKVVRIEPNPAARVSGHDPLTAYFEIYHLSPGGNGQARFQYVYTVRSAERDPRIWIQRAFAPRRQPPPISATREEEMAGTLRRQFITVPIQSLPPGKYRLEILVRDLVAGTEASRAAEFVKVGEGLRN